MPDPETVDDSIIARAVAKNQAGAKKLEGLEELWAMHVAVAGIAASEVRRRLEG